MDSIKIVTISYIVQALLVGRLFIEEELVDSSQVSCIKKEMGKPSYQYGVGQDTAWAFYNHVTHALKMSHPRSWMSDQQKFHEFMIAECLSQSTIQTTDTNNVESDPIDPNQLTIDQQIADVNPTEYTSQIPVEPEEAGIIEVDEETFDFEM